MTKTIKLTFAPKEFMLRLETLQEKEVPIKFTDFPAKELIIENPDDFMLNGMKLSELGMMKKQARVKRVVKLQDGEGVSIQDKYSWKCAFCDKIHGYRTAAHNCSLGHVSFGMMEGEIIIKSETIENTK